MGGRNADLKAVASCGTQERWWISSVIEGCDSRQQIDYFKRDLHCFDTGIFRKKIFWGGCLEYSHQDESIV